MVSRRRAYLALIGAVVIWGALLVIVKPAFEFIGPVEFLFWRFLVVSLVLLWPTMRYLKEMRISRGMLWKITWLEILGTPAALGLLYLGLARTTALESSLLAATLPVFITIGGVAFLRERLQRHELIGLTLGMLGAIVIVLEPLMVRGIVLSFSLIGNLLVVGFLILTAVYYLMAKVLYAGLPKLFFSGYSALIAVPMFLVVLWVRNDLPSLLDLGEPAVLLAVLYSSFLGWIVAFPLYLYGQEAIEASEASLFKYLEGVVALPVAWVLLGEQATVTLWIAIGLISLGVYIGSRRVGGGGIGYKKI